MFMKHFVEIVFMRKWILSFFSILCLNSESIAQDIPIGTWRTHFSYNNGRILEASEDKIFCAVQNGLFSLDRKDQSLNKISKVNGLSGAGISSMKYNSESAVLVIGYESGLIDLVFEDEIINIRDVKELREDFDKEIFDLEIYNGFVYAATNIGVIVVSLKDRAVLDNYRSIGANATEVSVFELAQYEGSLFAITNQGIQYGRLSENLLDFNKWSLIPTQTNHNFRDLSVIEDAIYLIQNDTLLSYLNNNIIELVTDLGRDIKKIGATNQKVGLLTKDAFYTWSTSGLEGIKNFSKINDANDFINLESLWIADGELGLVDESENSIIPNGPLTDNISNIELVNNKLYAFYGPKPEDFNGQYDSLGYDVFENGTWRYYEIDNFYNIIDVANFQENTYFASVGGGLYDSNSNNILKEDNSVFDLNLSSTGVSISDLAIGLSLWVTSFDNTTSLLQLTRDNEWITYDSEVINSTDPTSINVSSSETLWITRQFNNPIMINLSSNESRDINTNAGLNNGVVTDIELDNQDNAWLATTQGISGFPEATSINENIFGSELQFEGEGVYSEVKVSSVESDGGGRIWVAGKDQLAVYSGNIAERYFLFTEENSPLISTEIIKMEYNPTNGEMFMLTSRGLISYRSNSSQENRKHQKITIFPNPVRPNYSGEVGIKGVVSDADIKITDINGKLIQKIDAFGGTASWNLQDYNNKRVQAGIYLIFSSDQEGTETYIDKIAILY